jgi:hypothetical protein
MMRSRLCVCLLASGVGLALVLFQQFAQSQPEPAPASALPRVERDFKAAVHPFLKTYCTSCHGGEKPKGDLDLSVYATVDGVLKDLRRWETVLEQLEAGSMPPGKAKEHPTMEARRQAVAWIRDLRKYEAKRNAGDPGSVPARRLSNAEYDYTIRDLTGVDIQPAKEFPVDPANEAGFDNSAESLKMSPALLDKYLAGARRVTEFLLFMPDGLEFAPFSVVAETDRDKFGVRRIIEFYGRQRTDYADYFQAAWRYRYRAAFGQPSASLADIAKEAGLSQKYIATIWGILTGPEEEYGPVAALRSLWSELPAPDGKLGATQDKRAGGISSVPFDVKAGCEKMRDFVVRIREKLVPEVKNLTAPKMNNGSQPLVMWKNRQMAANRTRYAGNAAKLKLDQVAPNAKAGQALIAPTEKEALNRYEAAFARFCAKFPDTFYVSERARVYLDPKGEKNLGGRLLSAGLHSMTGYFRDDGPLYDLVLDTAGQQELDRLWLEFDCITSAPLRQHTSFIWFERSDSSFMRGQEFDFARAEDKDSTSEGKIKKLAEVYLAKARSSGASKVALEAIDDHFKIISAQIRRVETARKAAEPKQLAALQAFAEKAYRRPLSKAEADDIVAFYRILRDKDGLSHDDAVRDVLVSVLMSPHFLYLVQPSASGPGVRPLSDYALANRLSYFLWASMPDAELMTLAKSGDLHRPEVLVSQAKRMLRDPRNVGLAKEFAGNWLDFRRFEEHNAVDRERFRGFTDELRTAMFEEPIHFFIDLVRSDRSLLDLLYAKHTFVNPVLALHYGIPMKMAPGRVAGKKGNAGKKTEKNEDKPFGADWLKIDDADKYGRGGLLPMAVFLTKNAPGLRTSPVKRGYWVVRRLLGEKIPAPPSEAPELPADESKLGDLTLREVLARHRADKSCSVCHERFDALGLAFEGYGPVGDVRTKDLGGHPVDTRATFPGTTVEGNGLEGLLAYIKSRRQDDFVDNLCRKMLAYALGRTLLPSDDDLILQMRQSLSASDYRFSTLIDTIVTSPQFLNRRGEG